MKPLVSVITPTWKRYETLFNRCIPSVQAQTYRNIEHVIVCDGPDPGFTDLMTSYLSSQCSVGGHQVVPVVLPEHLPGQHWGSTARLAGIEAARGELIAYLDDDDAYRPDHCRLLAERLIGDSALGWVHSVMASHIPYGFDGGFNGSITDGSWVEIGWRYPEESQIGTPTIMHRREMLQYGTWGHPSPVEDWNLVRRWLDSLVQWALVGEVTVDVWPSAHWG